MAAGRVGGLPVRLQIVGKVLTSILELVLVQDHVKQFRRTLSQFISCYHLDIEVFSLRFPSRFY